jgi:hypothetical protein
MRSPSPDVIQIDLEMPNYDIIDHELAGADGEEIRRRTPQTRPNPPFSKLRGQIPTLREILRRDKPDPQYRQLWFEKHVLGNLAVTLQSSRVPYRFRTRSGERWQLDKGNVGHAMANGKLMRPQDLDEVVDYVELTYPSDVEREIQRQRYLAELSRRPQQHEFSERIRRNYVGRCAVTGSTTGAALQAAHIRLDDGESVRLVDSNDDENGILLRADIHALFDAYLFTFTADGAQIEISHSLTDPSYAFLENHPVSRPIFGRSPSPENIADHRRRFVNAHARS